MQKDRQHHGFLPDCVTEYIASVIKKVRYRRKVRQEVGQELTDHFTDALVDCESESQKQQLAEEIIADFGDSGLLAKLIRRAKKRCRPLWKKALIRTGQAMLVAYIISFICNAWVIHSWAVYSDIDYSERFNQLSRPETPQAQNAAPYYEKAAALFVEPPKRIEDIVLSSSTSLTDPNQQQQVVIEKWFADNERAWRQVVSATEIPYCWWEVDEISSENIENALQQPKPSRTFTRLGLARARQKAAQNQLDQALDQCYIVMRMGKHFTGPKLLIEHMVGTACITRAQLYILSMLDAFEPEKLPLHQIQNQLQSIFPDGFPLLNSQVEMNWNLGMTYNTYSYHKTIGFAGCFVPGVFLVLGNPKYLEKKTLSFHENLYQFTPYQYQTIAPPSKGWTLSVPDTLLNLTRSALESSRDANYCYKALHEALVTIISLQRWKLDKGVYPEELRELIAAGFLPKLPDDPYSDGILKYQRQGDNFILYSVGADFDDDGGVENHQDPWGRDETGGDRVFWPYVPREGT